MPDVLGTVKDIITAKGTKLYLASTVPAITGNEVTDLAAFDGLTWGEVGMVESISNRGVVYSSSARCVLIVHSTKIL